MIESFALIPLTQGLFATIDLEDLEKVGQHRWCAHLAHIRPDGSSIMYAKRAKIVNGVKGTEFMHRSITGDKAGCVVDHMNGDGLDNRKSNLRTATTSENLHNSRPRTEINGSTVSCKSKGVSLDRGRWRARIMVQGRHISLGMFDSEAEASRAYREYSTEAVGSFSWGS